jgi:hypothetical protein
LSPVNPCQNLKISSIGVRKHNQLLSAAVFKVPSSSLPVVGCRRRIVRQLGDGDGGSKRIGAGGGSLADRTAGGLRCNRDKPDHTSCVVLSRCGPPRGGRREAACLVAMKCVASLRSWRCLPLAESHCFAREPLLLRSPHRRAIDMKTSPAVVVDKLGPLLANDDRLAAAEATIRRIIDDLRRHPSGDARSFGRRQSSFDGGCRRWRDRRPSPLPSL